MQIADFQMVLRRERVPESDIAEFGDAILWVASRGRRPPATMDEWRDCFSAWRAVVKSALH